MTHYIHAGEICKSCNFYLGEAKIIKLIELNGGARFLQMDLENEEKYIHTYFKLHNILLQYFSPFGVLCSSSNGIF